MGFLTSPSKLNTAATAISPRILGLSTINQHVLNTQYAVRGELAIKAEELKRKLIEDSSAFPFKKIINCNIGNPQALGQKPITFFRQVSSLLESADSLLSSENLAQTKKNFPVDAVERSLKLLKAIGNVGAYTDSRGVEEIRANVANFITKRDGFPADPENIVLTQGASAGVQLVLRLLIDSPRCGVMIPIPQYPLYTATLTMYDGRAVPYYLNEADNWGVNVEEIRRALYAGRNDGVDVRALVIINPGNPTGNILSRKNLEEIIRLCKQERLVLMSDEVYQENVYDEKTPFISAKHAVCSMGSAFSNFELFSFHSVSKGLVGECGKRGGYFEAVGIDNEVMNQIQKMSTVVLCPNTEGQIMVDLMTNPPNPTDPSFALYQQETRTIYESLKRRSIMLVDAFRKLEGVTCNSAQGAMYVFPQIRLPPRAIQAAVEANKQPDVFYCLAMLDATGVCVVPGSGFGQVPGTYHFRSTFLPPEEEFETFIENISKFHKLFMDKYRD